MGNNITNETQRNGSIDGDSVGKPVTIDGDITTTDNKNVSKSRFMIRKSKPCYGKITRRSKMFYGYKK